MAIQLCKQILYALLATFGWPGLIVTFYVFDLILSNALKLLLIGWFAIFIILPLIFKFSYSLQRGLLFLNFISYPSNLDLTRPELLGLYATRNFHLNYEDEDKRVSIAAWHIVPNHIAKRFHKQLQLSPETLRSITNDSHSNANYRDDQAETSSYKVIEKMMRSNFDANDSHDKELLFEEILRKTRDPIILYLHGNTGTRANGHRVELYKILRTLGYHVIAMDYRGFADSSDISPTEFGCVNDALAMYRYIKKLTASPVFVYGHSLGTGIGLHMASVVNKSNIDNPKGVILEAPFNNMRDEVARHPFTWLFRYLPWFESTLIKPIYENGFRFESDQHIAEFREPVMIMHSEKDGVIPYELGYKLYRAALDKRGKSWGPAEFHRFEKKYGHKFIVRAKNFSDTIDQFVKRYKSESF